jgi:hypothetical protein
VLVGDALCWVRERELGRDGRSVLGSRVRAGTAGLGNVGDPVAVCGRAGSRSGRRSVGR